MSVIHDLASRDSIWKMQEGKCALLGNEIPCGPSFLISYENESKVYGWMGAMAVEPEVREEIWSSEYAEIMSWIRFSPDANCPDVLDINPGEKWGARENEEARLFAKHWRVVLPVAAWIVLTNPEETLAWRGYAYALLSNLWDYVTKHPVHGSSRRELVMWGPGTQWQKLRQKQQGVDLKNHQILGLMANNFDALAKRNMFVMNADNYRVMKNALEEDVTSALFDGSRWWNSLAAPLELEMPPFKEYRDVITLLATAAGAADVDVQDGWERRAIRCHDMVNSMCRAHQMDSDECYDWATYPALGAVMSAGAPKEDCLAIAKKWGLRDQGVAEIDRWASLLTALSEGHE